MSEHGPERLRGLLPQPAERRSYDSATPAPPYASYRDAVRGLMHAHEPFDEVEEAIDATDINEDTRAALWLLAFSMRAPRRLPGGATEHRLPAA